MAQKSILSFFKSSDRSSANDSEKKKKLEKAKLDESLKSEEEIVESPVKQLRSKRKVKCIESDDESSVISKVQNGDSAKDTTEKEENLNQSPENTSKQKNKEKKRNVTSSKKPPKKKKLEKEENEKSVANGVKDKSHFENEEKENSPVKKSEKEEVPEPPSKMEIDSPDPKCETDKKSKVNGSVDEPSTSTPDHSVEITPRRKTARKAMRSSSNAGKNHTAYKVVVKQPHSEVKNDDQHGASDDASTKTSTSDASKDEKNVKKSDESEESENIEQDLEDKDSENNKQKLKNSQMEIDSEQSENKKIIETSPETKDEKNVKKSAESEESENIEQDLQDSENNEQKLKKGRKSNKNKNKRQNKKNEKNQESKDFKEVSDDSKTSTVGKRTRKKSTDLLIRKLPFQRLVREIAAKKETSLKKTSGKESIQSFFTPIKKQEKKISENSSIDKDKSITEDNSGQASEKPEKEIVDESSISEKDKTVIEEESESKAVESDDSPVKKVAKRKRKTQCIDSDEEEEPELSEIPIKMEIDDSEKSEPTSKESKEETSINNEKVSENSSENNKTSPTKKEPVANSETDEKQKLGCKKTTSGTVYDPSKIRYHPIEDACWKRNEEVPYLALAMTLDLIENTSRRLKTIEILANFFRSVIVLSPNDLLQSVYLCLNRLAPEYEGIELGIGETVLMKAVAQATGRTLEKIKAEVAVKGDLGLVSESSRGNQRVMFAPPKLTVSSVFLKFREIAKMSGNAAMSKKTCKIQSLFVACRDCEAKYIIRSLSGKLRIGLAEQSILTSIGRAAVQTPPCQEYPPEVMDASKGMSENSFKDLVNTQAMILKTAYCECPNYDLIIPVLLKEGIAALPKRCQLTPGRPLKPMLAHPTAGINIVLERFDKNAFTCEYKYDGERAQIHLTEDGDVKIFSRNQENNTSKYPDVTSRMSKAMKETTKTFILDTEAVAWDNESKQILPFQVLSTRKKKDVVESEIVVQVCIMAFDLLYLNGESLVKKPLKERRSLLHSSFIEVDNEFMFAQYKDGNSAETMQEFLDESLKGNCEGLMVKALEVDASYEIAKRSRNWLKLKKDYLQGIGDTLDLVVIGGYFGKGKRTGNYGGFLLACYDEENEEFQSICRLGTGFKDENLEAHSLFLKDHILKEPKSYYRFDHSLEPDVWFDAVQVWEIKCADLSISPVHKAAIGIIDPEKGISLRFPRFIRIREDKNPESATHSTQIADMYQNQDQIQNTTNRNVKVDEDYY